MPPDASQLTFAQPALPARIQLNATVPKNLILYVLSLLDASSSISQDLREKAEGWSARETVAGLATYASVVDTVLGFVKYTTVSTHRKVLSIKLSDQLCQDIEQLYKYVLQLLENPENYKSILKRNADLVQQLLDLIQEMLDNFPDAPTAERTTLSRALLRLSRKSRRLPTCLSLTGLQRVGKQIASGGFSDIWKGLLRGQSVSVKVMRLFTNSDIQEVLQTFGREALIWRQLSHPNVLPFFGLYYLDTRLCLVAPWMADGHLLGYLQTAPPDTDRLALMLDVAQGLDYLHENGVVHGDLKGMNILVTPSKRACVADFGLSSITDAMTSKFTHSTVSARAGTARYQAPEIVMANSAFTRESDVYAFACVCYEIWTGKLPFHEIMYDVGVIFQVCSGVRPTKPDDLAVDDPLWLLLEQAWTQDPKARPTIAELAARLMDEPIGATPREGPQTDWDPLFSPNLRRAMQEMPLLPSLEKIERRVFGIVDIVDADGDTAMTTPQPSPNPDTLTCSECSARAPSLSPVPDTPRPLLPSLTTMFPPRPPQRPSRSRLQSFHLPISYLTANHYVQIDTTTDPLVEVFVSTHDLEVHRKNAGVGAHNLPPLPRMSPGSSPSTSPVAETAPQPPPLLDIDTVGRQLLQLISSSSSSSSSSSALFPPSIHRHDRAPSPLPSYFRPTSISATRLPMANTTFYTSSAYLTSPDLAGRTLVDNDPIGEFPSTPLIGCIADEFPEPDADAPLIPWGERWVDPGSAGGSQVSAPPSITPGPPETPSIPDLEMSEAGTEEEWVRITPPNSSSSRTSTPTPTLIRGPSLRRRRDANEQEPESNLRRPTQRRRTEPVMSIRSLID